MTVHHNTLQYPTEHHSTPWYTTWENTPCHGVHFSHISLQSHVTTNLGQSEGSILLNLSDLMRNCEISLLKYPSLNGFEGSSLSKFLSKWKLIFSP